MVKFGQSLIPTRSAVIQKILEIQSGRIRDFPEETLKKYNSLQEFKTYQILTLMEIFNITPKDFK